MRNKYFLPLLGLGLLSSAHAGNAIFGLVPTVKAPSDIYPGHAAIAYYQVTNNTPLTLSNLKVANLPAGVTQDPVGSGLSPSTDPNVNIVTCHSPFSLGPLGSCLLKLNISADNLLTSVQSGPEVCQFTSQGQPLFCSTPNASSNRLTVIKHNSTPSNAPTLSTNLTQTLDMQTGVLNEIIVTNNSSSETVNNITADFSGTDLADKVETITPNPYGGAECNSVAPGQSCVLSLVTYSQEIRLPSTGNVTFTIQGANSQSTSATAYASYKAPNKIYQTLLTSPLKGADIWDNTPKIMSANYAFEGIQAAPNGETAVLDAGGAWNIISTPNAQYGAFTATGDINNIANAFGYTVYYDDAMPICFSQPIITSTINPTDFRLTLNTGKVVTPDVASLSPNFFYNESSCVVIFGRFGNRLAPGETGAVYPVTVSIVAGSSNGSSPHLTLIDANGTQTDMTTVNNGSGASITSGNPYVTNGGPSLLAAKLSTIDRNTVATTQTTQTAFQTNVRNDGAALYGSTNTGTLYRLRMYTSGGFALGNFTPSITRPMSLMPTDYNNFFRVQVGPDSNPTYLSESGHTYTITGYGTIKILGLASLGNVNLTENDAYIADNNNYIDIIMVGDDAAMRQITYLDIPTTGNNAATQTPYLKLYNPGGPGNNPTAGVTYSQAGPPVHIAVTNALDNANIITYP